ncbi:MAG: FIST C-terminal domain-containing protein, partial [Myxococcales bacterium]|nr:FIST C-terminal domain-containing protein [Myxococcales bacterium]
KVGVEVVAAELGGDPGVMPSAEDNLAAGRSLGEQLRAFDPKLVMLFADGVCSMPPELVRGLQETAGSGFPVVGGCASEREHVLVGTAQFIDDRVLSRAVVAVAFRGPLRLQSAAGAGFQSLGRERTCTSVEGKYMLEIDGRPAVEMYQQLLEIESIDDPVLGVLHPLAMVSSSADGDSWNQHEQVIRVVQKFDERGALLCGGDIHEGALVRITRATREDLLAGAVATCERALARLPEPEAAFIFNCAARKMILGPRHYRAEIDAVFELLPANLPRVGFYTYGELAPVGGRAMYHNATFTIVLMSRE